MTISYHLDASTASAFPFLRLLFRWKASVWKLVLSELILWTIMYLIVSFFYRTNYFMTPEQKDTFEHVAHYFNHLVTYIPFTFILGFIVDVIVTRWSSLFMNIGYVESQAIFVGNYVQGDDKETRLMRRAMVRYMCLTQALVFRDISVSVRRRFPTMDSLVGAGLLLEEEKNMLDGIKLDFDKYWVPTNWIFALIFRARREGKITHDILASKLCDEIKYFRYNLQVICNYDWVPLPLVYLQTVFLATYAYFATCLIGRQNIITDRNSPYKTTLDMIFPLMTMVQFFFVIGWVKVAQGLLNPFGDDDDDFECNYLIDKNLATSLCIVDDQYDSAPEVKCDRFWHNSEAEPLYSRESVSQPVHPYVGSAVNVKLDLKEGQADMVPRPSVISLSNTKESMPNLRRSSRHSVNVATLANRRRTSHRRVSSIMVSEQDIREIDARLPQLSPEDESPKAPQGLPRQRLEFKDRTCSEEKDENPDRSLKRAHGRRNSLLPSMKLFSVEEGVEDKPNVRPGPSRTISVPQGRPRAETKPKKYQGQDDDE